MREHTMRFRLSCWPLVVAAGLSGCRSGAEQAAPESELAGGAITVWTDSTELFMEHPALIVGQPAKFNVHLTDLTDFAPLRSGRIELRFEPEGGGESFTVTQDTPRSPGIYGPAPVFPRAGLWKLTIAVASPQARDDIVVPPLTVHATEAEAPRETDDGGGGIAFLKEQQWKTAGFATTFARHDSVVESFAVTGRLVPAAGRYAEIAAPLAGLVDAQSAAVVPFPGQRVRRGQVLVTLIPSLEESGSAYAEARGRLREAEEEHARVTRLVEAEAVPRRRLHEAEIRLQVARETLAGLTGGESLRADGRLPIRSPISGVIATRRVVPGARVEAGTHLMTVVDPAVVWLEVNLPAARIDEVRSGSRAWFTLEGSDRLMATRRLVSRGSVIDSLNRTIPFIYEVANPDGALTVGANARAMVSTGRQETGVVIPASALLDEDGRPVAYVQAEGERFERRELEVGGRDGDRVLIRRGLEAGERVVTGAAYQVRLASLSTAVPAHGHEH